MTTPEDTRNRKTVQRPVPTDRVAANLGNAGRYVLLSEIASGGQSTVYLGRDTELGRPVAVKVLLDHSGEAEIRIKREARVLAQLKHPAICQIFDIGTTSEHGVFLVLELLEGNTLRKDLESIGPISIGRTISIVRDIAEALRVAHAHNVVHRDLKPENIAILPDGTVKLFDFGIAKATQDSKLTVGMRIGTNGYMSPEQYMAEPVDGSSDIFSLGCIFYELLTGHLPFETGKELRTGRYEPLPDSIRRDLGAVRSSLLTRMLTVDQKTRPSAGEVADALTAVTPPRSPSMGTPSETEKIVRLLDAIPDENSSPLPVAEIAGRSAAGDDAMAMAILQLPLAFGALRCAVDDTSGVLGIRAASEVAHFFLKSLALYVQYGLTLIERWDRRDDPSAAESVPMLGADFVYAMERRRVFQYGLLQPIRFESPVQVIVKGYSNRRRSVVYLVQYDRFAQQYQLIGGRRRVHEPPLEAMQRVVAKELPGNDLRHGVNCEFNIIRNDIEVTRLSRTVGAFTEYRFSIFSARFEQPPRLGEYDRWITEEELLSGKLHDAAPLPWNVHVARIASALNRGLAAIPISFAGAID